ncbi:M20/M25/M40 family metallo-hydrolase [Candidatus Bipolaricaulota bacterium]|nr:M20/M25/M40 family metallo-hydrolase [Candidatus Bipolaricaulota bacterium]
MNERLIQSFCDMVQIDSESGNEGRFIDYIKELVERDFAAETFIDTYGNLVAHLPAVGASDAEPVFFGAHADTVKPGIGIEPIIEGDVIRSKGNTILGADDKAGLAAILEAIRSAEIRGPIDLVITLCEEAGLLGAKNLDIGLLRARHGYIVDSDVLDRVTIGGATHASIDIEITGKAAHAASPEHGISAIHVAAEALNNIQDGRLDKETVANVGTINGGVNRNGVPETVTIQAECRSLSHEKCMTHCEAVKMAFEGTACKAGATATVTIRIESEAAKVDEAASFVQDALAAMRKAGFKSPRANVVLCGSDAFVLTGRGVDAVVIGYGGKGAHSVNEHIRISDLEKATEILRYLIEIAATRS